MLNNNKACSSSYIFHWWLWPIQLIELHWFRLWMTMKIILMIMVLNRTNSRLRFRSNIIAYIDVLKTSRAINLTSMLWNNMKLTVTIMIFHNSCRSGKAVSCTKNILNSCTFIKYISVHKIAQLLIKKKTFLNNYLNFFLHIYFVF